MGYIRVDDDFHTRLKIEAARHHIPMGKWVQQVMEPLLSVTQSTVPVLMPTVGRKRRSTLQSRRTG